MTRIKKILEKIEKKPNEKTEKNNSCKRKRTQFFFEKHKNIQLK